MKYPELILINEEIDESDVIQSIAIEPKKLIDVSVRVEDITIELRENGKSDFYGKAFYLPFDYDWVLGYDNLGVLCLVPLKKEGKK